MTDLHCHILPNIDDGAKDVSISLRLLEKEYADGVRNIAFTSHFNSEWTTPDAFLQKRAAAYVQINAGALLDSPKLRRTLCKFISWQLVHVISTDTHSLDKRPPRMAEAAAVLEKELGRETASKLLQNGDALFDDEELDVFTPRRPKKFLNFWM